MNWGFVTLCGMFCLSIGLEWARHGEPNTGKHNVVTTVLASAITLVVVLWAMHWKL